MCSLSKSYHISDGTLNNERCVSVHADLCLSLSRNSAQVKTKSAEIQAGSKIYIKKLGSLKRNSLHLQSISAVP